jgi:hypothetical protein
VENLHGKINAHRLLLVDVLVVHAKSYENRNIPTFLMHENTFRWK